MDKKTPPEADQPRAEKIFFAVFFTLIAAVMIITYMKYFVAKDYYITAQGDCDPTTQKCFIWKCDPNSTDPTEKCTGDPDKDTWYYQDVKKIANQIPLCDPDDQNCKALECDPGMDCQVTYCNDITKKEEKVDCSDPDEYNKENPPADNSGSGGDQSCDPSDPTCNANTDNSGGVGTDNSAPDNSSGTDNTAPDNSSSSNNTSNTTNSAAQ